MTDICTSRLCLRSIKPEDSEDMIRMLQNDTIKKTYMIPDLDQESAHKLFCRFQALSNDPKHYVWGIGLQDKLIGWINDLECESGKMELGWVIDPAYSNQGYATEAVRAAVENLFAQGIHTVCAGAFSGNTASIRVMEKVGMHRVDKQEKIPYRGTVHQCVFYEISK